MFEGKGLATLGCKTEMPNAIGHGARPHRQERPRLHRPSFLQFGATRFERIGQCTYETSAFLHVCGWPLALVKRASRCSDGIMCVISRSEYETVVDTLSGGINYGMGA